MVKYLIYHNLWFNIGNSRKLQSGGDIQPGRFNAFYYMIEQQYFLI